MEQPEPEKYSAQPSKWQGLKTRTISGAVLLAVTILLWKQGGWLFSFFIVLAALVIYKEWCALTEKEGTLWRAGGLLYTTIPCASMIWLREVRFEQNPDAGMWLVLYLLLCVWATDIGAYFTGRSFGKHKLAPAISPGKTWEGLAGGMALAAITGGASFAFTTFPSSIFMCALMAFILGGISQMGDLFESWVKRRAGVKDSGTLIPGHGGLLDRIDGLMFATPLFALAVWFSGLGV